MLDLRCFVYGILNLRRFKADPCRKADIIGGGVIAYLDYRLPLWGTQCVNHEKGIAGRRDGRGFACAVAA